MVGHSLRSFNQDHLTVLRKLYGWWLKSGLAIPLTALLLLPLALAPRYTTRSIYATALAFPSRDHPRRERC